VNTNAKVTMTADQLTVLLAEKIMRWRVTPDRFLTGSRGWMPRWKFRPTKNVKDAFRLLDAATPEEYCVSTDANGDFGVKVKIGGVSAKARDRSQALAICRAVAAAVGIKVEL
jgi:hypothetical protein